MVPLIVQYVNDPTTHFTHQDKKYMIYILISSHSYRLYLFHSGILHPFKIVQFTNSSIAVLVHAYNHFIALPNFYAISTGLD